MTHNFKLTLSYDGTDFHGWQTQPDRRTVQETLEKAIEQVTREPKVRANASGRTDAGVHALGQVVNFHSATGLTAETLHRAINANLPEDMAVQQVMGVSADFDANRDALRKLYRYVIFNGSSPSPFLRRYSCPTRQQLDVPAMTEAARTLNGCHDFSSFETAGSERMSSVRTILHLKVSRFGDWIWIDVEGNGFLYNMVRAIAGSLINVGRGYWPPVQIQAILEATDRTLAGPTAPAKGLFLMRVSYEP